MAGDEFARGRRVELIGQAHRRLVVIDVVLQIMAAQFAGQPFEFGAVARTESIARGKKTIILAGGRRSGGNTRQRAKNEREQRNEEAGQGQRQGRHQGKTHHVISCLQRRKP